MNVEHKPANSALSIAPTSRSAYFLRRARFYLSGKDEKKFQQYHEQFLNSILPEAMAAMEPDDDLAAMLYKAGEHAAVIELFERFRGRQGSDLLPILAASIFFARAEPHKSLTAAREIRNFEQRRLRQKTAELWPQLMRPLDIEPRVHLLILTHNREDYVAEALRQLAQTSYSNYAVYIADNGSSDSTLGRVREAVSFFPSHVPVSVESFPVNIGRPAGHNWLLAGHDHKEAEFIAIGDDDLIRVPPDWLTRMIQTARAFPGCGCVGGKALTPGWPASIHGGVRNFTEFGPNCIDLTNNNEQDDIGQFDYVDMVDHVIGCLHIFDRAMLEATGLFDIRLSPCQMVDIEHHLRMGLAGRSIIFNGLIGFEHLRAMGVSTRTDKGMSGNSLGNMLKILYKYDNEEARQAIARQHEARNAWLLG